MPLKGYKFSEEHKKRLRDARRASLCPHPMLGRKHSKESIEKMRVSHIGKKHTAEHKEKIAKALSGERNYQWGKGERDGRTRRKYAPRPCPEKCESCGTPASRLTKGLFVDHNHGTNEFRGWLCTRCNVALGMINDDPKKLKLLIKYLGKYGSNLG